LAAARAFGVPKEKIEYARKYVVLPCSPRFTSVRWLPHGSRVEWLKG
jgi:hypothetical protein